MPPSSCHSLYYRLKLYSVAFPFILICIIQHKGILPILRNEFNLFLPGNSHILTFMSLTLKILKQTRQNSNQYGGPINKFTP